MIYIGIDPGARWTGVSTVVTTDSQISLDTTVVDGAKDLYLSVSLLTGFMIQIPEGKVCIESYRSRPVGHQAWNDSSTVKLIGALEYAISHHPRWKVQYQTPGNAEQDLERIGVWKNLRRWKKRWGIRSSQAGHGLSAWRVLLLMLMKEDPQLLNQIIDGKLSYSEMDNSDGVTSSAPMAFIDL